MTVGDNGGKSGDEESHNKEKDAGAGLGGLNRTLSDGQVKERHSKHMARLIGRAPLGAFNEEQVVQYS